MSVNAVTNKDTTPSSDWVVLGKITTPFGVKGWIKVHSFCSPEANLFNYQHLFLIPAHGAAEPVVIEEFRPHQKGFVAKLKGVDDRNQAETLKQAQFVVSEDELNDEDDEESYYWYELEGLRVVNTAGIELGKVSHLFETGANDVMVVHDANKKERLIPYVLDEIVLKVNLTKETILVDWDADF